MTFYDCLSKLKKCFIIAEFGVIGSNRTIMPRCEKVNLKMFLFGFCHVSLPCSVLF